MNGEHTMDSPETVSQSLDFSLGEIASGSIDPETRDLNNETLTGLERDIRSDRYDVRVLEGYIIPCGCIDGRCPHEGEAFNAIPNAAGGTLTPLVGELLTNQRNIAHTAETSEEALASFIAYLQNEGFGDQVGGHTGPSHGSETASGCGANDKLYEILTQIVDKSDALHGVLEHLGIPVDTDAAFPAMVDNAKGLLARDGYFASGKEVASTLGGASLEGNCPALTGEHNEVIIRLNTVEGTTIDRRALKAEYGDDYQIFNVDVWALQAAANRFSETQEEADAKFTAMVTYQLATALQLCGPGMRVIVR